MSDIPYQVLIPNVLNNASFKLETAVNGIAQATI